MHKKINEINININICIYTHRTPIWALQICRTPPAPVPPDPEAPLSPKP